MYDATLATEAKKGHVQSFVDASWRTMRNNSGMLLIGASQAFFSLMYASVKMLNGIDPPVPTFELVFVRMLSTWVCCAVYMHVAQVPDPFLGPKGVRMLLALRGICGFTSIIGVYYSLLYLSLSDATVLTFLVPLCTAVTAAVFLGEEMSWKQTLAGVSGLLGVVLIARPAFLFGHSGETEDPEGEAPIDATASQRLLGIGCAIIGVLGATGAYTTIHAIGKRAHPLHNLVWYSSQCVLFSAILMAAFRIPVVIPTSITYLVLLIFVGLFGFVAQYLLTLGLQLESAGRGTMAVYVQIVFAMIFEWMFFHTTPSLLSFVGTVVIMSSAIYVAASKKTESKDANAYAALPEEDTSLEEGLLASQNESGREADNVPGSTSAGATADRLQ